jgi:hypothetical protein
MRDLSARWRDNGVMAPLRRRGIDRKSDAPPRCRKVVNIVRLRQIGLSFHNDPRRDSIRRAAALRSIRATSFQAPTRNEATSLVAKSL